ncbi:MAG: peptidase T [Arcanobacterium sp.]|nr:peptidase T [Arcanobacterium sp.]
MDQVLIESELVTRFLRYSAIDTQSNSKVTEIPSTPGQWKLAKLLVEELTELGLSDVEIDEHCCVTAVLPGNGIAKDSIGFCAHLDTADVNLCSQVRAQVVKGYQGGIIELGNGEVLDPKQFPELNSYLGQDIICTDGTSVLGADDKAAIAAIMTALHFIVENKIPHGDVHIAFVPDEEIGLRGAKVLDLAKFSPKYAYTIDSAQLGELVFETFNAGVAEVLIRGVSAHPMSAKGNMVNPNLIAVDLANTLNPDEVPERTEGREGYIWLQELSGNQSTATVILNIRDHDLKKYNEKKARIAEIVKSLQDKYPRAHISVKFEDVYGNISDAITAENRSAIDDLEEVFSFLGIEPIYLAMRGGTDGSYLSSKGLLTPNFFTGAHNFHSVHEFLPVGSFRKSCEVILGLVERS